ncbi:MAG: alpha/beta fold hydrolase [Ignavibacteria bacterium]
MIEFKINEIVVQSYGDVKNPPLIFVHAFPFNSRMWESQVHFFKDKFRIITYDVRSAGKTIVDDYQFTMETLADDFNEIVTHLGLKNVNAVGLSMGGYILLRSYQKNPSIFKTLTLADTKAENDDNTALLQRSSNIKKIKDGKREEFENTFISNLLSQKNLGSQNITGYLKRIISEQNDASIVALLIAIATRLDSTSALNNINIPTLLIFGEEDKLTPLNCARTLKEGIKNSELAIIPCAGHLSNIENQQGFNKTLEKFLLRYNQ